MRGTLVVIVLLAAACGSGDDSTPAPNAAGEPVPTASTTTASLDACDVLRAMDLSRFLGAPPHTYDESVHNESGTLAFSMCHATPTGGMPQLTLTLRRDPERPVPRSRQEWIDREFGDDAADMGLAELQAAEEVAGLGDYALAYSLMGQQLVVYWSGNHYLNAGSIGISDAALAREAVTAVAREAVARH